MTVIAELNLHVFVTLGREHPRLSALLSGIEIRERRNRLEEQVQCLLGLFRLGQIPDEREAGKLQSGLAVQVAVILRRGNERQVAAERWQDVGAVVFARQHIREARFELVELRQHLRVEQLFAAFVPAGEVAMQDQATDQSRHVRQRTGIRFVGRREDGRVLLSDGLRFAGNRVRDDQSLVIEINRRTKVRAVIREFIKSAEEQRSRGIVQLLRTDPSAHALRNEFEIDEAANEMLRTELLGHRDVRLIVRE